MLKYTEFLVLVTLLCTLSKSQTLRLKLLQSRHVSQLQIARGSIISSTSLIRSQLTRGASSLLSVPIRDVGESEHLSRCEQHSQDFLNYGQPRWGGRIIGPIVRYLNTVVLGTSFLILLRVLNRFRSHNEERLFQYIWKRNPKQPLISMSNHQSMFDDPGLFAAMLPWWRIPQEKLRWNLCTEDVFFANPLVAKMMAAGNIIPIDRSGSFTQITFFRYFQKILQGKWVHIFPEGRIWQSWRWEPDEEKLGPFRIGIGKLLMRLPEDIDPIIIPCYHTGMDTVLPEKVLKRGSKKGSRPISMMPKTGQKIDFWVGNPFSLSSLPELTAIKKKYRDVLDQTPFQQETLELLDIYAMAADVMRDKMLEVAKEARAEQAKGLFDN